MKTLLVLGFAFLMLIETVQMEKLRCSWCICHHCRSGNVKRKTNSPCYMEFFDVNGDGHITKQELMDVLTDAGPVSEHAKTVFVIMDKNADGMVVSEEFYEAVHDYHKKSPV